MATFKICIFPHQKRPDGKYPVSIRVTWKGQSSYINSAVYVMDKQITDKTYFKESGKKKRVFEVKDPFVLTELNTRIKRYENIKVTKLGYNIDQYTAKELAGYFKKESAPGTDLAIDFIEFAELHLSRLIASGKVSTARVMKTHLNGLVDYCSGRRKILIAEITSKFLAGFDEFLRGERTLRRDNKKGKTVITTEKGLSDISVHDYMTTIKTIFRACMNEYNDEDKGEIRIRHYPFKKYKPKAFNEPCKRVLTVEQIRLIRDVPDEQLTYRGCLAKHCFMASFFLAGTNMADFYNMTDYNNGRLSYYREKTRDRRKDKAFISIKVIPEVLPFIQRYKDGKERVFRFYKMYACQENFVQNIDIGLKDVAAKCGIPTLTTYYARFSFASIARNKCGVSKDDVHLALNHVDQSMKITDGYIEKDWSILDDAVRKVAEYVASSVF